MKSYWKAERKIFIANGILDGAMVVIDVEAGIFGIVIAYVKYAKKDIP